MYMHHDVSYLQGSRQMALTALALIALLFAGYGSPASKHISPTFSSQFTASDSSNQLLQHSAALSMHPSGQQAQSQEGCFKAEGYRPEQIAHAYSYDQFWNKGWRGQGMTVDLYEGEGVRESDLQHYFDCVRFKGSVQYVNVGKPPQKNPKESDYGQEATLDIEMIAGLAPNVHIVDYQTNGTGSPKGGDDPKLINQALQRMITDHQNKLNSGDVVSISWGPKGEIPPAISPTERQAIHQSLQTLTEQDHMTVFVASGDCGAFESGKFGDLSVGYPSSDPYAATVGGTELTLDNNGNRASEKVWSTKSDKPDKEQCTDETNDWGSGGGLSKVFPQPLWQKGLGTTHANGKRQLPDIAVIADNIQAYYSSLNKSGEWNSAMWDDAGGTSASAPIWAAGMALVNQGLIAQKHAYYYGPALFYFAAENAGQLKPYYDVTEGWNLFYYATPGWDYATGFGTPNLADFFNVLSGKVNNMKDGMYKGAKIFVSSLSS